MSTVGDWRLALLLSALLASSCAPGGRGRPSATPVPATSAIEGTVTDTLGQPISEAVVSRFFGAPATTDSTGRFRISGLQPGRLPVGVRGQGYVPGRFDIVVPPESTPRVSIQLVPVRDAQRCLDQRIDPASLQRGPVFRDCEVGREAVRLGSEGGIEFAGVDGTCYQADVLVVVDSTGMVETETARIVRANNARFGRAVLAALPGWRYRPALKNGRPVRQLVLEQARQLRTPPRGYAGTALWP